MSSLIEDAKEALAEMRTRNLRPSMECCGSCKFLLFNRYANNSYYCEKNVTRFAINILTPVFLSYL